mmetsp:Transcript_6360/g.21421  ORF Transcript_6360/g.21421 Transcript_6360/m.21421 type:complete len:295 (+) Transcript_6360:677-1561(+)
MGHRYVSWLPNISRSLEDCRCTKRMFVSYTSSMIMFVWSLRMGASLSIVTITSLSTRLSSPLSTPLLPLSATTVLASSTLARWRSTSTVGDPCMTYTPPVSMLKSRAASRTARASSSDWGPMKSTAFLAPWWSSGRRSGRRNALTCSAEGVKPSTRTCSLSPWPCPITTSASGSGLGAGVNHGMRFPTLASVGDTGNCPCLVRTETRLWEELRRCLRDGDRLLVCGCCCACWGTCSCGAGSRPRDWRLPRGVARKCCPAGGGGAVSPPLVSSPGSGAVFTGTAATASWSSPSAA